MYVVPCNYASSESYSKCRLENNIENHIFVHVVLRSWNFHSLNYQKWTSRSIWHARDTVGSPDHAQLLSDEMLWRVREVPSTLKLFK